MRYYLLKISKFLQLQRYKYLSHEDAKHVPEGFKKKDHIKSSGPIFRILGSGDCNLSEMTDIDLALNFSDNKNAMIRHRLFELPRGPVQPSLRDKYIKYYERGEQLVYRPGKRDRICWQYYLKNINDIHYMSERRIIPDPVLAINFIMSGAAYMPFYSVSLISALLIAFRSGAKQVELYGFSLSHCINEPDRLHKTLIIRNGENAITHAYRLCYELERRGCSVNFMEPSALSSIFNGQKRR